MSRKRLISPSFFTNADLFDAESSSGLPLRVCFAGLWTVADRRGIFRWSRNLKPRILPYDACDILACLSALERAGFVRSYVVSGRTYGHIPTFAEHQTFHNRERPSTDPAPEWLGPAQGQYKAGDVEDDNPSTVPAQGQPPSSPTVAVTVTGTAPITGTVAAAVAECGDDVGACLASEEHRIAYAAYRKTHSMPDGLDAALRSCHAPITGGRGYDWPTIGQALVEMRGASVPFSARALRRFCEDLARGTDGDESPAQKSVRLALAAGGAR